MLLFYQINRQEVQDEPENGEALFHALSCKGRVEHVVEISQHLRSISVLARNLPAICLLSRFS